VRVIWQKRKEKELRSLRPFPMLLPFLSIDVPMHGRNYQENYFQEDPGEERTSPHHAQLSARVTGGMGYERGGAWRGFFLVWREEGIIGHNAMAASEGREQTRQRQQVKGRRARMVGEPRGKGKRTAPRIWFFLGCYWIEREKTESSLHFLFFSDFLLLCVAVYQSRPFFFFFFF
jgi:hypothetical protein